MSVLEELNEYLKCFKGGLRIQAESEKKYYLSYVSNNYESYYSIYFIKDYGTVESYCNIDLNTIQTVDYLISYLLEEISGLYFTEMNNIVCDLECYLKQYKPTKEYIALDNIIALRSKTSKKLKI